MTLPSGTRLGPYEITAKIGEGGMGEVYRARDTRLARDVAIKVLPSGVVGDPDRLRRFEQEAKAVSALNHPNIVTLHEVGRSEWGPYLVLELIEGSSLRELQRGRALPIKRVLALGAQIAEGLAAAHAAGIVHRDLKPGNVMVTEHGLAKIHDFGLAKLASPELDRGAIAAAATRVELTAPGMILGTLGYLSPEQAAGKPATFHSDQFALGAMLYEMATGERPFRRETTPEALTAVIREEPESLRTKSPSTPAPLVWIVERCLAKDPDDRYASTRDLARELADLRDHLSEIGQSEPVVAHARLPPSRGRERLAWGVAALAAVLAAVLGVGYLRQAPSALPVLRTSIVLPGQLLAGEMALSPDGEKLAFTAARIGDRPALFVRALDVAAAQPIAGSEDAHFPFWSPDGRFVAFFSNGKMKKVDIAGGPVLTICAAERGTGGTWNRDGTIVFAPTPVSGLFRLPASGGQPLPMTKLDRSRHETSHRYPFFLPDGRHFLYSAVDLQGPMDGPANSVRVASLDGGPDRELVHTFSNALYSAGSLVYVRGRSLLLQRFDPERLRTEADPVAVAERPANPQWLAYFAVSASDRLLIYRPITRAPSQLQWFDRQGKLAGTLGQPGLLHDPRISPDGRQVGVDFSDPANGVSDLWLYDVATGAGRKFVFGAPSGSSVWSPDASRIAVFWNRDSEGSRSSIWIKSLDGTKEEIFAASNADSVPEDWSRDGRHIAFNRASVQSGHNSQVWVGSLPDGKDAAPVVTTGNNSDSRFSPDGRWLAYASDESGRSEIWVRPFPPGGEKWQISAAGGAMPAWRGDGRELYYLSLEDRIMAVPVSLAPTFHAGPPAALFQVHPNRSTTSYGAVYDVRPDGQRFLVNTLVEDQGPPPLNLIFHWTELLEKAATPPR